MTVGAVMLGVLSGLMLPAFMVSTGLLVSSLGSHSSTALPLAAVVLWFVLTRAADPVREAVSHALWKRVDHWLIQRLMRALISPPGLSHIEEPAVQDAIDQARGTLIERTPGEAAYFLAQVISTRVQGLSALVLVATFHWYLAATGASSRSAAMRTSCGKTVSTPSCSACRPAPTSSGLLRSHARSPCPQCELAPKFSLWATGT